MSENAEIEDVVKIKPRDHEIKDQWSDKKNIMSIDEAQHSYDTTLRERAFIDKQFKTENEKSRYKKYREEWFRRPKEFDPGDAPLAVTCELVSICNLACRMCYTVTDEFQNSVIGAQRMLPWPIVKSIIDECADLGVPSMLFSWRGESSMYRSVFEGKTYDFGDVLKYAREKGILEITSLTNGHFINKEVAEKIIEAEPSWISFSIDGLEQAYNKIRVTRNNKEGFNGFLHVTENIKNLIALRNEKGKTRPAIRVNTVYPAISENPQAYNKFMKELGVDFITVNELLDMRGEDVPEEKILDDWACQYPYQRLTISANGIILPCTGAHNEEGGLVLGRYKGSQPKVIRNTDGTTSTIAPDEITIKGVWKSDKLNKIRDLHRRGLRKSIVPGCRYCRHGVEKNGAEWVPDDWDIKNMEWTDMKWRT